MDLTGIMSVSGYGGLFKLIKQSKAGFIVESLIDKKRMQAFASSKISTLEDIAIYTETGEVHLKEVFRKIFSLQEGKAVMLDAKSAGEEYKDFFDKILPDYDKERVYVSDIRKVILWYNILVEHGMVDLEEDKKEEETEKKETKETVDTNIENTGEPEMKEKKTSKKTGKKAEKKEDN